MDFDHGLHGLHGFQNAPNRFGNHFHNLFIIRVNPCNPWLNDVAGANALTRRDVDAAVRALEPNRRAAAVEPSG